MKAIIHANAVNFFQQHDDKEKEPPLELQEVLKST